MIYVPEEVSSLKKRSRKLFSPLRKLLPSESEEEFYDSNSQSSVDEFTNLDTLERCMQVASVQERIHGPSHSLFNYNPDLQPLMRCKLIGWLVEVAIHFHLHRETLFLAVHYMDRFLSLVEGVQRDKLQLIGITSLFIAAKLEVNHLSILILLGNLPART